jgi:hypothetical protein
MQDLTPPIDSSVNEIGCCPPREAEASEAAPPRATFTAKEKLP